MIYELSTSWQLSCSYCISGNPGLHVCVQTIALHSGINVKFYHCFMQHSWWSPVWCVVRMWQGCLAWMVWFLHWCGLLRTCQVHLKLIPCHSWPPAGCGSEREASHFAPQPPQQILRPVWHTNIDQEAPFTVCCLVQTDDFWKLFSRWCGQFRKMQQLVQF